MKSLIQTAQSRPAAARPRFLATWAPAAIAVLALALRLHGLGDKPLWLDEVTTLNRATMSFPALVDSSLAAKHYPTYFALLWLVAKLGTSPWLLRLPSAIFGAIDAALVYIIGRDIDGPRTGLAAGLLLALSPFDVLYGQEARSYTLVAGLILIALWGLLRLAREPERAAQPLLRRRMPAGPWLAYGFGTAAALNVLNVAVPWFVAANLAAVAIAYRVAGGRSAFLRNWVIVQALIILCWLPGLIAVAIMSKGTVFGGMSWAPPETWATIWAILAPVYLDRLTAFITFELQPATVPGLSLAIAAAAAYGAWRLRGKGAALAVIACAALVLPAMLLLISLAKPVLVPRYFAWSAAPFFVLSGAGFARLAKARFAGAMAVLGIACLAGLLPYYRQETKPRWDLAAAKLAAITKLGDIVLLDSWQSSYVLAAFSHESGLDNRNVTITAKPAEAARLAPGHALWVVFGRTGQGAMRTPVDYLRSLAPLGQPTAEEPIGRYITLWRFSTPNAQVAACDDDNNCPSGTTPFAKP